MQKYKVEMDSMQKYKLEKNSMQNYKVEMQSILPVYNVVEKDKTMWTVTTVNVYVKNKSDSQHV
jgi:hypothetical protein